MAKEGMGIPVTCHFLLSTVSLSLDPETASPKLMVSEDQKSVKRLLFDQDVFPSSRRFNQDPCTFMGPSDTCVCGM